MQKPARKIWTKVAPDKYTDKPTQILSAVDQMVNFVAPTLGPKIRHILVDSGYKTELMDDGVSILREFELEDDFEDAVCRYVKEASEKTDDKAGDGTTTTALILQALLHGINASGKSYPEIRAELEKALEEVNAQLAANTTLVDSEESLYKVAKTSMNDEKHARLIAEVIWKVGAEGAVTNTDHTGKDTVYEKVEGFTFGRGFIARGMINNKEKQTYEAPNKNFPGPVAIFITEELVSTSDHIIPILNKAENEGYKNIAIFAPNIIGEAMGVIAINQARGAFNIVGVQLPGQGEKTKDFVQDLRTVTGYTDERGFGIANSIKVTDNDTTVIGGQGDASEIKQLVDHLQTRVDESKDPYEKDYYHMRQARLYGGVVIIKVGGTTESETNLRLKKVDDAVNACKCALKEGVVPGGGVSLARLSTSSAILNEALQAPLQTLLFNASVKEFEMPEGVDETFNVLTGETGNFLEVGVVDATKVLRTAVENAVSLATILFSVSGIITSKRDE